MSEDVNPYKLLQGASRGDAESIRALAERGLEIALENGDETAFTDAMIFGRMLYANTGNPEDAGKLLTLFAIASTALPDAHELRSSWCAEAVALAAHLADMGNPDADEHLAGLVDRITPEEAEAAKFISRLMKEAVE